MQSERRYLLTKEVRAFLRAIKQTAGRRVNIVSPGAHLWRAQAGASTIEVPLDGTDETMIEDYSYEAKRMKPLAGRAREGRANPKGIPYLYLATRRETAAVEVRPWKGGVVSVGQFRVVRDLRLVNTTLLSKDVYYLGRQPSAAKRVEAVWGAINHAFAVPSSQR